MNSSILTQIEKEISEDKEAYLNNCKINYSEYVSAAQKLFPDYYNSIDSLMKLYSLNEKSLEFKKLGDTTAELTILEEAIAKGIDTPYTYERVSIIYAKQRIIIGQERFARNGLNPITGRFPTCPQEA